MQQVPVGDVEAEAISNDNQLPKRLHRNVKRDATRQGAVRIPDLIMDKIVEETIRRTSLEFEEEIQYESGPEPEGDTSSDEDTESEEEKEEESDDDESE